MPNPTIATIDLSEASGTASDYRGVDFRKPLINRNGTGASPEFVDIPGVQRQVLDLLVTSMRCGVRSKTCIPGEA